MWNKIFVSYYNQKWQQQHHHCQMQADGVVGGMLFFISGNPAFLLHAADGLSYLHGKEDDDDDDGMLDFIYGGCLWEYFVRAISGPDVQL